MKLSQHKTTRPFQNLIFCFTTIMKNCKLELFLLLTGTLWIVCAEKFPDAQQCINAYFSESRCSNVASYTSITIGIYVTIWSIFATSSSGINIELFKKRIEGQLFFIISVGLIEAFASTFLCVFFPRTTSFYSNLVMVLIILTTVSFVKLIYLVMIITKLNIEQMIKDIDSQNKAKTAALVKLDEIYDHITKNN